MWLIRKEMSEEWNNGSTRVSWKVSVYLEGCSRVWINGQKDEVIPGDGGGPSETEVRIRMAALGDRPCEIRRSLGAKIHC